LKTRLMKSRTMSPITCPLTTQSAHSSPAAASASV
jgi:hypothetical protein